MKTQKRGGYFAIFMILNILFEVVSPSLSMALTNGPMQPEFLGFEPANSSEMVDLFTGDFKYNIPLMDVDGYPLNLSYKAGSGMENEASWVGLGWSLNPGVLNRLMKGLPDDFNGDEIHSELYMKPFTASSVGESVSAWWGIGFIGSIGYDAGTTDSYALTYNNHKGYGYEKSHDSHFSWNFGTLAVSTNNGESHGTEYSSQDGDSFSDTYTSGTGYFAAKFSKSNGQGTNYNTRNGAIIDTYFGSTSQINPGTLTNSFGFGTSTSLPYSAVSYPARIPFNLIGGGESRSYRAGLWGRFGAFGFSISGGLFNGVKGNYNSLEVVNTPDTKSYGFLYSQNADANSLMDFDRFRDAATMQETPYTSFSSSTYDLFFAAAQGMNSAFRPFRSDINVVRDPVKESKLESNYTGYELGLPIMIHYIKESSDVTSYGLSDSWDSPFLKALTPDPFSDIAAPTISNFSANATPAFIERAYFKEMGELCERDEDFEATVQTDDLISPSLIQSGADFLALSPINNASRKKRDKRSKNIQCLTANQADQYGFEPRINHYDKNVFALDNSTKLVSVSSNSALTNIDRNYKNSTVASYTNYPVKDHISEVTITNSYGDQYIYGIPAYNLLKKTVAFNVSSRKEGSYVHNSTTQFFSNTGSYSIAPLNLSEPCQYVQYEAADKTNNKRGQDNFFKSQEIKAYASSYLLTDILSSDYVDITGNGTSYDDLGNFTKFNYSKENDYKWREPYCINAAISGTTLAGGISTATTSQANFDKGLICDQLDDKAEYEYGIRENYYIHSIETKNYVAVFRTSTRSDGLGVQDEDGAKSTSGEELQLDAVELYSKNEILQKGGVNNAIPIKSVHFVYDYTLCPNTFNTLTAGNPGNGKLTLKKVYFTYGTSKKSSLSPYEFDYADNEHSGTNLSNFYYEPRSVDRWGSYKPNLGTPVGGTAILDLNNVEYPYSEQNKKLADQYAAAWNLTQIKTPSGATIKITYEADDYGYVQDRPASQMCKIYNCASSISSPSVDVVSSIGNPSSCNIKDNPKLIIDLSCMLAGIPTTVSLNDANTYAKNFLFYGKENGSPSVFHDGAEHDKLYFKSFLKVAGPECGAGITENYYDFINGYSPLNEVGLFDASFANNTYTVVNSTGTGTHSCYRFAYVSLDGKVPYNPPPPSPQRSTNGGSNTAPQPLSPLPPLPPPTSPICLAGWDFLRNYAPRIAYPGSEPANMGGSLARPIEQKSNAKAGLGVAKIDLENGILGQPNKRFYDQDFCVTLYPSKSFARVYSSHHKKLGGGHRVKQITTEDGWNTMTSSVNSSGFSESGTAYGQTFDYSVEQSGTNEVISSGVASYEPLVGGDENSLRQPIPFEIEKTYAPNDDFFQEAPLGEMLYPSPVVGYVKVTMRVIPNPTTYNIAGSGKTEFEFFTAKDFPITDITEKPNKILFTQIPAEATLSKFVNRLDDPTYDALQVLYATQGNIVKFNDMHGKLKSVAIFGEDNLKAPISKMKYYYKCENNGLSSNLVTSVPTIDESNIISTKVIGRDIDVTADSQENMTEVDVQGDNNIFEWGIMLVPFPYPPGWIPCPDVPTISSGPIDGKSTLGYKGATLTKVIQEYGILEKVETTYNGSISTTENLLWDANTGKVILTRVTNELDQPVYNFNYPAYWAYKEMGPEFKRDGIALFCPSLTTTSLNTPLDVSTGIFTYTTVNDPIIFEVGDEVLVTDVTNPTSPTKIGDRFWFIDDPASSNYLLVDRQGKLMSTTNYTALSTSNDYVIRVIKPVNKNKLNASMGYVTSLNDPQNAGAINYTVSGQKIIDAGAQEYCSGRSLFSDPSLSMQAGVSVPIGAYSLTVSNPIITEGYTDMKPTNSYKYNTTRNYSVQPNKASDGLYSTGSSSFTPFWFREADNPYWTSVSSTNCGNNSADGHGNWKAFTRDVYYSPYGDMIQASNAIKVPSAQRSGFNHTLPILQARNARANEVGFESFEECASTYSYLAVSSNSNSIFNNDHLGFYGQVSATGTAQPVYTNTAAHTGRYSLSFAANQGVNLQYRTKEFYGPLVVRDGILACGCRNDAGGNENASKLDLDYGKTYIMSMWVKGNTQANDYSNLVNFSVTSVYSSSAAATTNLVKSAIINGWQKLDYEVTISAAPTPSPSTLHIIIGSGSSGGFYMDDFRVQPFNATMVCKVYDPYQMRLCAELDDRNYAIIYEYDQEGMLVRKKKETLNALYTVQETRTGKNKR